uniref:Uncharacterized protein n=1 Tax=Oryza brachyantha TaxID=4533 RepID=J3N869_ORYBR
MAIFLSGAKDTTLEVWNTLRTMHMGADRVKEAKIEMLSREIENLHMSDTESVDDSMSKITLLVAQMQALGEKVEENNLIKRLLRVVSDKYDNIVTMIEYFGNVNNVTFKEVVGSLQL